MNVKFWKELACWAVSCAHPRSLFEACAGQEVMHQEDCVQGCCAMWCTCAVAYSVQILYGWQHPGNWWQVSTRFSTPSNCTCTVVAGPSWHDVACDAFDGGVQVRNVSLSGRWRGLAAPDGRMRRLSQAVNNFD
jgi:hypothetical protein